MLDPDTRKFSVSFVCNNCGTELAAPDFSEVKINSLLPSRFSILVFARCPTVGCWHKFDFGEHPLHLDFPNSTRIE